MNRIVHHLAKPNTRELPITLGKAADLCNDHGYDAHGNIVADEPTSIDAFAFDGRHFDPTTELQWNMNRHFDPQQGQWLSEDPIAFNGLDENLRRYVSE